MSITANDLKFVEQLISQFAFDKIKFNAWVEVQQQNKKKFGKRLMIVSKYRVFLLKRSGMISSKMSVSLNFHLYQISSIASTSNDSEIILTVSG